MKMSQHEHVISFKALDKKNYILMYMYTMHMCITIPQTLKGTQTLCRQLH